MASSWSKVLLGILWGIVGITLSVFLIRIDLRFRRNSFESCRDTSGRDNTFALIGSSIIFHASLSLISIAKSFDILYDTSNSKTIKTAAFVGCLQVINGVLGVTMALTMENFARCLHTPGSIWFVIWMIPGVMLMILCICVVAFILGALVCLFAQIVFGCVYWSMINKKIVDVS